MPWLKLNCTPPPHFVLQTFALSIFLQLAVTLCHTTIILYNQDCECTKYAKTTRDRMAWYVNILKYFIPLTPHWFANDCNEGLTLYSYVSCCEKSTRQVPTYVLTATLNSSITSLVFHPPLPPPRSLRAVFKLIYGIQIGSKVFGDKN